MMSYQAIEKKTHRRTENRECYHCAQNCPRSLTCWFLHPSSIAFNSHDPLSNSSGPTMMWGFWLCPSLHSWSLYNEWYNIYVKSEGYSPNYMVSSRIGHCAFIRLCVRQVKTIRNLQTVARIWNYNSDLFFLHTRTKYNRKKIYIASGTNTGAIDVLII